MTRRETPARYFSRTWQAFYANLGSLRLFSEQIAQVADRLDRDKMRQYARELANILDDDPVAVEADLLEFVPSLDEIDVYPDFRESPNVREALDGLQSSAFKERLLQWAIHNPRKAFRLAEVLIDVFARPPASGVLLRRSALIVLVGFLDVLFEALFFGYFNGQNLGEIPGSSAHKNEARKKASRCNRSDKGWPGRINNFHKLGVDVSPIRDYMDELVEIVQRRNLLVHSDGRIDGTYLKRVSAQYRPEQAEKGRVLIVSTRYLQRAFYVITIIGFWLTQACWRQWYPRKNIKKAHELAHRVMYNVLQHEDYSLVIELGNLAQRFQFHSKHAKYRHYILANQAIAFRELGENARMREAVNRLAKTKHKLVFDIALAILKEDFSQARRLLLRAKRENLLPKISPYWPLFKPVWDELWFDNLFAAADVGQLPHSPHRL